MFYEVARCTKLESTGGSQRGVLHGISCFRFGSIDPEVLGTSEAWPRVVSPVVSPASMPSWRQSLACAHALTIVNKDSRDCLSQHGTYGTSCNATAQLTDSTATHCRSVTGMQLHGHKLVVKLHCPALSTCQRGKRRRTRFSSSSSRTTSIRQLLPVGASRISQDARKAQRI